MWETYLPAQEVQAVAPPLFLGLLQDPCPLWERVQASHLSPCTPVLEGRPRFPQRPPSGLRRWAGQSFTPPLTCAAAADSASIKAPSGSSFAGPQSRSARWGFGGEGVPSEAPGAELAGLPLSGLGHPPAQRGLLQKALTPHPCRQHLSWALG